MGVGDTGDGWSATVVATVWRSAGVAVDIVDGVGVILARLTVMNDSV
jgi:hypothetical protein